VTVRQLNRPLLIKPAKELATRIKELGSNYSEFAIELEEPSDKVLPVFANKPPDNCLHVFISLPNDQRLAKRPRLDDGCPEGWLQLDDDDPWKIFGDYWRKQNDATMSDVLSITPANDEKGKEDPNYRLQLVPETENKIIVRDCYKRLYEYIRDLRDSKYNGLVLTGQPGTGASSS
jgi:hypothetical protein